MNADPAALLALISELYSTVARLTAENLALHEHLSAVGQPSESPAQGSMRTEGAP